MTRSAIHALILLHIRKVAADKANLFWLFGMPIMFTVLMGAMFGGLGGGDPQAPAVTVYDASGSEESAALIDSLRGKELYRIDVADSTGSLETARALVREGRRTAALYIPFDYADSLSVERTARLHFFFDQDRASAQTARTALDRQVQRLDAVAAGRRLVGRDSFDTARFDSLWNDPRIALDARSLGREETEESALLGMDNGFQHTGPSYTLMFVMMFMLMSVRDIVAERRTGTLTRLRLGSASPSVLAVGLFLGPLLVGLMQAAVLLGLNLLIPGMDYGSSPLTLVATIVVFTAGCSGLALLVATFCRTPGQADGFSMTASLLLAALGGLWWPLEIVPGFMKTIGLALPTGRAITIFHNMIGRGWGLAENQTHLLWLLGFMLVVMILARRRLARLVA